MEFDRVHGRDKKIGTRPVKRYEVCERERDLLRAFVANCKAVGNYYSPSPVIRNLYLRVLRKFV